jgi:hypothetical protein
VKPILRPFVGCGFGSSRIAEKMAAIASSWAASFLAMRASS